ncbi:MAG: nucleotidyltransferase family protein [Phycisphaeraceae bacterium]|nr:nucleotidyltransferase family protein [Phycisphaeraceae bacterium]
MTQSKIKKVLLLAGGLGTRLKPLTDSTPKCLIQIAGRPMLDYWFDRFEQAELFDVRINNHHIPQQVRDYIEDRNEARAFHVSETYESILLGSAGTVHANRDYVNENELCVIVYADNLSDVDLAALVEFHQSHDDPFTRMLFHTPYPTKCGIATLDDEARITNFVEKPQHPTSDLANGGIYVLDAKAYHEIADMNAFDLGFDVLPKFIGRMRGWVWNGYHRDIGTHESLDHAKNDIAQVFV